MEQIELKATKREALGKKVKALRRQGITPVHLFGHGIESLSLQCDAVELRQVMARAGRTRLVNLTVDNEKAPRNIVIREVQTDPLIGASLHVDFYEVRMTETVKVEVPIVLVGEAPALKLKENILAQELNSLDVECLPAQIPTSINVDISSLTAAEQAIRVKDITMGEGIVILNDPEVLVVKITVQHEERPPVKEAVAKAEVAEAAEAAAPAEGEGAAREK